MALQSNQQVIIEYDVPARMRDGVTLRATIYRPAGEGRWPVLLTRLPYGMTVGAAAMDPAPVARRGYVVIIQDTRGRGTSEGEWIPFVHEPEDGVDTVAWAAQLPYSTGEVGMYGGSYFAFTQWAAAIHQPSALKAIVPAFTWNDPYNGVSFRKGALELGAAGAWQLMMEVEVILKRHSDDPQAQGKAFDLLVQEIDAMDSSGYASLPLNAFAPFKRHDAAPYFFEGVKHPMDRAQPLVRSMHILGHHHKVIVPSLNVGGWYDAFLQDTLTNFRIMREEGGTPEAQQSKLVIGPWSHGGFANPVGEVNFGFRAGAGLIDLKTDLGSLQMRWFDHWLKGIDTGLLKEAPIQLFVMGANVWRAEYEWPLARAEETRYYLQSDGHANTLHGDGTLTTHVPAAAHTTSDQYDYDPVNPVPTRGGALLMTGEYRGGPYDQHPLEDREDVLVYTSDVLAADVEVTGPIKVHLWAISSVPDTDFVARLIDVHPDGYARNLTDGIVRARYRHFEQGEQPSLIEPGQAYEYEIDLWSTSNLFQAGHRIRLDVTSSSFPRWDRNPNTGHDFGADAELAVAHQTILHDSAHPSFIVLPIVPAQ